MTAEYINKLGIIPQDELKQYIERCEKIIQLIDQGTGQGTAEGIKAAENYIDYIATQNGLRQAILYNIFSDAAKKSRYDKEIRELIQQAEIENGVHFWNVPDVLELSAKSDGFNLDLLPPLLSQFAKEHCKKTDAYPEMIILPLLTSISACVMDKYNVYFKTTDYTQPLCLYGVTVANSGEMKSDTVDIFKKPIEKYQANYNKENELKIKSYKETLDLYKSQIDKIKKDRLKDGETMQERSEKINELIKQRDSIKPYKEKTLILSDVTTEGLIRAMNENGGKMSVIASEGTTLANICGQYTGKTPVNTEVIKYSYDRDGVSVSRAKDGVTRINKPALTIGIATQPDTAQSFISNPALQGEGVIQRFLFSYPKSKAGYRMTKDIQPATQEYINLYNQYETILTKYLTEDTAEPKTICFDAASEILLSDYRDSLQVMSRTATNFQKQWLSKHFGRCIRICALLHLTGYSPDVPINAAETMNAIQISMWFADEIIKTVNTDLSAGTESPNADSLYSYMLQTLKKHTDWADELFSGVTGSNFRKKFKGYIEKLNNIQYQEQLNILDESGVLEIKETTANHKNGSKGKFIKLNPFVFDVNKNLEPGTETQ